MVTILSENRIKCGKCGSEFDLNKNGNGCPLCGFGSSVKTKDVKLQDKKITTVSEKFLSIPPILTLEEGEIYSDDETETWGSWLMFNDFFAPKFLARLTAWEIYEEDRKYINLFDLMKNSVDLIKKYNLGRFKGFPNQIKEENIEKDNAVKRLVNHFLQTSYKMGLFNIRFHNEDDELWTASWKDVEVTLTKQGLEFARLKNSIFDEHKEEQVLSKEESDWILSYLKEIDKIGYKEYSNLKDVFAFIKSGKNGNKDLWKWFKNNEIFKKYILNRSERARKDNAVFEKQLDNYAKSYASVKISLLRELGIIRNKRNDYSIIEGVFNG